MSMFPETSLTLIKKMAVEVTGERESAWARFFDLYMPAIRKFAEWHGRGVEPDDIVQEVLSKLVMALNEKKYDSAKASFRAYLATMIRNQIVTVYRRESSRGYGKNCSLDEILDPRDDPESGGFHMLDGALIVSATQPDQVDYEWASAIHWTAVEHVLTKTAMSKKNKEIYKEHVLKKKSAEEVAKMFSVKKNLVGQIKFRVERAIEQVESELCGREKL